MIKGYRLKVYRAEGTTQWFSAITSDYNEEERVSELSIIKRRGNVLKRFPQPPI